MFEYLKLEVHACQDEIQQIQKELKTLPEGCLIRRGALFTHRKKGAEKGITRNSSTIRLLARKKYLQKRLQSLAHNLSVIQPVLEKCKPESPSCILSALSQTFRSLPQEYFFYREEAQAHEPSPFFSGHLTFRTNQGLIVRSKSELIIANTLDLRKVPYQYEAPLKLGEKTRYPDFTLQRPSDGQRLIWEHFGMLDDPKYLQNMNRKLALYAENGYHLLENLICSYEKDVEDSRRLHNLIDLVTLR